MARRKKNPWAAELGRKRMEKLTAEQRRKLASTGGKARFKGWAAEQISAEMKRVRARGQQRPKRI